MGARYRDTISHWTGSGKKKLYDRKNTIESNSTTKQMCGNRKCRIDKIFTEYDKRLNE